MFAARFDDIASILDRSPTQFVSSPAVAVAAFAEPRPEDADLAEQPRVTELDFATDPEKLRTLELSR